MHQRPDQLLVRSVSPWKRLISRPVVTHESVSLIIDIFSDNHKIGMVRSLRGDDAQVFVDLVDQVLPTLFRLRMEPLI